MATALGIHNPNSKYNRHNRRAKLPALPLPRDASIRVTEQVIRAMENLRAFHYKTGNLDGARLHAIRIGIKRGELRRMRAG